jgi:hypothetical protein
MWAIKSLLMNYPSKPAKCIGHLFRWKKRSKPSIGTTNVPTSAKNPELRAILEHNRDDEKEHASMLLEWIRRADPRFTKEIKTYLFSKQSIAAK